MIAYNYGDIALAAQKDLLMTDGTVTVSGTNYTVTGGTVTIDNSIIEAESFELKQSLNSGTQIQFGSCEAAEINFVIHENIPTIKGKTLKVYIIPDYDASKMLQIGVFKVAEDKLSADRTKRSITAFDALYDIINADVAAWYNSEFPNSSTTKTLAQFRTDFLNHFSITAESTTLTNDSITISRTISPETLSGADVIRAICEINGCFGTITNEGKFRYVELANTFDVGLFPSDTLYPANDLYPQSEGASDIPKSKYIDVQFEDYVSEGVTKLTIRTTEDDVGVTVGTEGNHYIITSNFLVAGLTVVNLTAVATNVLNKIKNRPYTPASVTALGNPLHEVGDAISIHSTYRTIKTYIFERRLSGIQALRDTYTAQGEQYFDMKLNSVQSQYKELSGMVASLKVSEEGISSTVSQLQNGNTLVSYINQNATTIDISASKINLTGYVGINSGLEVDANGYVTMNDASAHDIDIDGGRLWIYQISGSSVLRGVLIENGTIKLLNSSSNTTIELADGDITITGDFVASGDINVGTVTCDAVISTGDIICDDFTAQGSVTIAGSIAAGNFEVGKTFTAHGNIGDWEMKLQRVTIGSSDYYIYAHKITS